MQAIILAGGLGSRLRPLTQVIPKPLLPVGEKSLLEINLNQLKKHGFRDITLATNYKSEMFESHFGNGENLGIRLNYSKETKPLGTAGPLKLVDNLQDHFLVMNGDLLTNLNFSELYNYHLNQKSCMTLVTQLIKFPLNYGVVEHSGNEVTKVQEKPKLEAEVNAGIYMFSKSTMDYIPENVFYSMTDLFDDLLKNNQKISRFVNTSYWLDIGQMENYEKAQKDIEEGII